MVANGYMEGCLAGPTLLVAPDNVWYGGVTEADVPELVERHLVGGEPVELLRIGPEDFCGLDSGIQIRLCAVCPVEWERSILGSSYEATSCRLTRLYTFSPLFADYPMCLP